MSQIRPILEALARDELLDITDSLELSVPDRRRKALLVEAIEGVRFDLREVLLGFALPTSSLPSSRPSSSTSSKASNPPIQPWQP